MAYQSYFAPQKTTAPQSGGGTKYVSYFGNNVQADGTHPTDNPTPPAAPKQPPVSLFNKVKNFAVDTGRAVRDTAEKSANTVAAGVGGAASVGVAGVQAATGHKTAAQNTIKSANKTVDALLDHGVGNKGGYISSKDAASSNSQKAVVKGIVQGATDIAPYAVPEAKAGSLISKVLRTGAANAIVGGAGTAAEEKLNGQKLNAKDIAKGAATNAVLSGAMVGAHGGAKTIANAEPIQAAKAALGKDKAVNDLITRTRINTLPQAVHDEHVATVKANEAAAATPQAPRPGEVISPQRPTGMPESAAKTNGSSASSIPEHPATSVIRQHMAENYKPASDHPDEAFAASHLQNNTDQAVKAYQARTEKIFGSKNIVGGDDAKYAIPGMAADKSVTYHEPASQFAKGYYKHLLTDPDTTHKPVMITAGGTGAGKTSALKKYFVDNGGDVNDYAAIVDTNLTNLHSATSRIEPALATGHAVHVKFVYRDPVEAYQNGVIPRAAKEGRAVTAGVHADTHSGSLDAIKQIADKYKDNPNVHVEVIDNSRGAGNSIPVNLDFLHDKSYTKSEIEAKIHDLLDRQLQEGKLTNEQHTIFKGSDEPIKTQKSDSAAKIDAVGKTGHDNGPVEPQGKSENVGQPQPERQSGQVKPVEPSTVADKPQIIPKVAQRIAKDLKANYSDLATIDKVNLKEQADKAAALISDREALDAVISGEKPLPDGLRATSVITALRPEFKNDPELLLRVANSPLSHEASMAGQELRIARENAANDPVQHARAVQAAKAKAFAAKTGKTVEKATSDEVKAIRAAKPKVTPETWDSFIESIKC